MPVLAGLPTMQICFSSALPTFGEKNLFALLGRIKDRSSQEGQGRELAYIMGVW
jgi:hypothetical protein